MGKHPLQTLMEFNRRLTDRGCADRDTVFFEPEHFPWVRDVEARWPQMQAELMQLMQRREMLPAFHEISSTQKAISDERWKTFFLLIFGHEIRGAEALCPVTAATIRAIPGAQTAMFSILEPGKHIPPHVGYDKAMLRYHLGLAVPASDERCAIQVGGITRSWREGASLIFDDTFVHDAWNKTDQMRAVLFVDVERKMTPAVTAYNRALRFGLRHLTGEVKGAIANAEMYAARLLDMDRAAA